MSSGVSKEDRDILVTFFAFVFGIPLRLIVTTLCLYYGVNHWQAHVGGHQRWQWWYGTLLACCPGWPGTLIVRGAIVLAIATFLASFFI